MKRDEEQRLNARIENDDRAAAGKAKATATAKNSKPKLKEK